MRRALVPVLLSSLLLAVPASASSTSSVDELTVTRSGDTITLTGKATLIDASNAVVGTDVTGDPEYRDVPLNGIGADLTSARVQQSPDGGQITFTLSIADQMATIATLPETIGYHWQIRVTNGAHSIYYMLQAMRSGQHKRFLPSPDPLFRVMSCGSLASGAPTCGEVAGYVPGTMANGIVQWRVSSPLIGAFPGATIEEGPGGLKVVLSASGVAYVTDPAIDQMTTRPFVVGPAVGAGIIHVEEEPALLRYTANAALGPDGTFTAKLSARGLSGDHIISVRACNGDSATCGLREVSLTI